jgi:hypothetical protein
VILAQELGEEGDGEVDLAAPRAPDEALLDQRFAEHGDAPRVLGAVAGRDLARPVAFEVMTLVADPELTMFAFTAEPGSKSEEALNLLATWTATLDEAEPANLTDR